MCTCAGSAGEAGLLPRAIVSVFTALAGQLYPHSDLKPILKQEVRRLSDTEVRTEEDKRNALLREVHAFMGQGKQHHSAPAGVKCLVNLLGSHIQD